MTSLSVLDGSLGFRIDGIDAYDSSGLSVSSAGDVNGDGIDDLIIGAYGASPDGREGAGESYLIYGQEGFGASFDLASLDGATGTRFIGASAGDYSGYSVSGIGDINGDGFDDIIIGARGANNNRGDSYVVFGSSTGFGAELDLSKLDGSNGFALKGIDVSDFSGWSVSGAGDVNDDGLDDFLIGARGGDPDGNSWAGETYLIFGQSSGFGARLNLSSLDGNTGVRFDGGTAGDYSGYSVSGIGDLNDDGIDDLIIGAYGADPDGKKFAGESYVVFGSGAGFDPSLDLEDLDGGLGFRIVGVDAYDYSGYSVSDAGDVNGDGIDDLIIGAYGADPNGQRFAGESYLVFGNSDGFSARLDLASLDGSNGVTFSGINAYDYSGWSVSGAGDVNGDGFEDILIGARRAENYTGEVYLVFGKASGFDANVNLSSLDGKNGVVLEGVAADDNTGFAVSAAGDINGDGFDDLIIGAQGASSGGQEEAGVSYVIYGALEGLWEAAPLPEPEAPVFDPLPDLEVDEKTNISVDISATDADGNDTISLSAKLLLPNGKDGDVKRYSLTDNGDGTGVFSWAVPKRLKDGVYTVEVTADDGLHDPVVDSFEILVRDTDAPVFDPLEDAIVDERSQYSLDVAVTDPDGGETVDLSAVLYRPNGLVATGSVYSFTDNSDGTGTFDWKTPGRKVDGVYRLELTADDGENALVTTEMNITVLDTDFAIA